MKYIITDKGEVVTGGGFHHDLARHTEGSVVAAGHYRISEDGWRVEVYGNSIGYGIVAKPEDAKLIEEALLKEK